MAGRNTLSNVLNAVFADQYAPFAPLALSGGQAIDRGPGVIELVPETASGAAPTLISAGIHGNETAPLELLQGLALALDRGELSIVAPTLLIVGHPESIPAKTRYLDTNLNRLFRRESDEPATLTREHQRARQLMDAVDAFWMAQPARPVTGQASGSENVALHLDMHTAIRASEYPRFVVSPFSSSVKVPETIWQTLSASGLQAVLMQHRASWTFSHYSQHYHEVVSFTLELGKVAAFGDNDMRPLAGMQQWLDDRVAGRTPPSGDASALRYFQVVEELMRDSDDFALAFDESLPNFSRFSVGETIATDATHGDTVVVDTPVYVVFPNAQVEKGARAALLVRPRGALNDTA